MHQQGLWATRYFLCYNGTTTCTMPKMIRRLLGNLLHLQPSGFISEIAAHELKPVFIIGCFLTSICYFSTICAVNHIRHSTDKNRFIRGSRWWSGCSIAAMLASLAASISLIPLSVLDVAHARARHRYLFLSTFGGLGLSAILTTIVWSNHLRSGSQPSRLRT